MRQKNYLSGNR